jgi:hypothetical protein
MMSGGSYRTHSFSDDSAWMKPLAEAASSQVTLFRLTGADSPFTKAIYQFTGGSGGVTTDYAQYFVLIKDAKPTHTMEGSAETRSMRPFVVKTEPPAESRDVAPGVIEIKVTFSENMRPEGFSFVTSMAGLHPHFVGEPTLDADQHTFVIKAKVEPGKVYAVWLNTPSYQGFHSAGGDPAVPYLLVFKTGE